MFTRYKHLDLFSSQSLPILSLIKVRVKGEVKRLVPRFHLRFTSQLGLRGSFNSISREVLGFNSCLLTSLLTHRVLSLFAPRCQPILRRIKGYWNPQWIHFNLTISSFSLVILSLRGLMLRLTGSPLRLLYNMVSLYVFHYFNYLDVRLRTMGHALLLQLSMLKGPRKKTNRRKKRSIYLTFYLQITFAG